MCAVYYKGISVVTNFAGGVHTYICYFISYCRSEIAMDQINFPRFWNEKPALWFAQVEAVFALNNITSDTDKYDYILTELNNDVIILLEDIILNPPEAIEDKYVHLKEEILQRLSISQLKKEELGIMKPSKFLEHLRNKADSRVLEGTITKIWLNSLPKYLREIVALDTSGDIKILSDLADKVMEFIPPSKKQLPEDFVCLKDVTKSLEKMSVQLVSLQVQLSKLQQTFNERNNTISTCKSPSDRKTNISESEPEDSPDKKSNSSETTLPQKSPDRKSSMKEVTEPDLADNLKPLCWYHRFYGDKAHNCIAPCSFKENLTKEASLNVSSF